MRSALPAVAAAALLVLAGCSGVGPSPDPTAEPAPTTEAPAYPPGVSEDGLENADALVDSHREHVVEHGAVTNATFRFAAPDDDSVTLVVEETWRATAGLDRIRHTWLHSRVTENGTTERGRIETYANESVVVARNATNGDATTTAEPREWQEDALRSQVARESDLERALTEGDFRVAATERRGGRVVTTLEAYSETLTEDGRQMFAATVEVAESGRVLSLSVTRDADANTAAARQRTEITWSNATTVERPAWADDAQ